MNPAQARGPLFGAALVAGAALSGCWTFLELDDKTYTLGGAAQGGAGQGGGAQGGAHEGMVHVQAFDLDFFIDATEVTNAAYAAWLAEGPSSASPDPRCSWNGSVLPGAPNDGCPEIDPFCTMISADFAGWAATHPNEPVACVDFCDAKSFCEARGKHLCGGPGGLSITFNQEPGSFVGESSEWFVACVGGAANKAYPYGATLDEDACNDGFQGVGNVLDVASAPACVGGYDGLFDMSGNVDEWIDACYPGDEVGTSCVRAGGAYYSDGGPTNTLPSCAGTTTFTRRCHNNSTGFRCCD